MSQKKNFNQIMAEEGREAAMSAKGISEPKATGKTFSIARRGSLQAPKPASQNEAVGGGQAAATVSTNGGPANPVKMTPISQETFDKAGGRGKSLFNNKPRTPQMVTPATPTPKQAPAPQEQQTGPPSQNRRPGGYEAFLSRGLALSGTPQMRGKSRKPGFIFREGPFKGMNRGQAEEKARSMYANLPDAVRAKYEKRAGMLDVRSKRERDAKSKLGLPMAGQRKESNEEAPQGKREGYMDTPGDDMPSVGGNQGGVMAKNNPRKSNISPGTQAKIDAARKARIASDKKGERRREWNPSKGGFDLVREGSGKRVNANKKLFATR